MTGATTGYIGIEHRPIDRRLDIGPAVVDAGEAGAVVVARSAVEDVALTGLTANQEVVSRPARHLCGAALVARMEDVDPIEDIIAASARKHVRAAVIPG